ncbi:MAG: hypothetical protein ABWY25_04640, partial [Paenisporosarcina sp.]
MKWLTNKLQRLFSTDREDSVEIDSELEYTDSKVYIDKKTPFRFPLISDDEKDKMFENHHTPLEKEKDKEYLEGEIRPLYMHKKWQQNKPSAPVTQTTLKPEIKAVPQIKKIAVATKAFSPTQVPSPIHGFTRPEAKTGKPIEELLAKKNLDELKVSEPVKISERPEKIRETNIISEPIIEQSIPEVVETQFDVFEKEEIQEQPAVVKSTPSKTLPFNVMMLKS